MKLYFGVLLGFLHQAISQLNDPRKASNGTLYSIKDAFLVSYLSGAENSCIAYPERFWDIKIHGFSQRKYRVLGHLKLDKIAQTHFSRADKFAKMV